MNNPLETCRRLRNQPSHEKCRRILFEDFAKVRSRSDRLPRGAPSSPQSRDFVLQQMRKVCLVTDKEVVQRRPSDRGRGGLVVGALSLDVTRLLALVADLLAVARVLGAVPRVVAVLATVVALAALETVACDSS